MTEDSKQNNEKISAEDYENLLDKYQFSSQEVSPGKIVTGRVVKVMPAHILVDIGLKSEGLIPIEDFTESADARIPSVGDEIEAVLERTDSKEGYFILSKRQADARRALELLEKAYEECLCYELQKEGLSVEKALPLVYDDVKLDAGYRVDLLVEEKLVLEIKSVEALNDLHFAQILTYLKLSGCKLGLLLNFNTVLFKDGVKRVINGQL